MTDAILPCRFMVQNPAYRDTTLLFIINSNYMKAIKHLIKFLTEDIWHVSPSEVSGVRYLIYEIVKKIILAIRFFTNDRVRTRAASLTYSTMLATVPIFAFNVAAAPEIYTLTLLDALPCHLL